MYHRLRIWLLGGAGLLAIAAVLFLVIRFSTAPAPVEPVLAPAPTTAPTLMAPSQAASPGLPPRSQLPGSTPGQGQTPLPVLSAAPGSVSPAAPDNPCGLDRRAEGAYLRPEHYSALQPQFRQAANLPLAPPLYKMELSVNPGGLAYQGQLTLTFWNRSPQPMPYLLLRTYPDFYAGVGGQLTLSEVTINGRPATLPGSGPAPTYTTVQAAVPLAPCSQVQLGLRFSGKLARQLREDAYAIGTFYAGQGFFALGTFYPQLALWEQLPGQNKWDWTVTPVRASSDLTAAESAYYDVVLTAPTAYQVIASGVATRTEPAPSGQKSWRFVGGPLREFAAVGSDSLTVPPLSATAGQGNIAVRVYTVASTDGEISARQQDFARKALEAATRTLDEFGAAIAPYPYSEYTLVQTPLAGFNGIEWPMFSQFSFELFRRSYSGQEQEFNGLSYSKPGTLVVIHEVLHQWWYNLVGNDQQSEPFIDEGLTEYCTYLLAELEARRKNNPSGPARAFATSWLDKLKDRILRQDLPAYGDLPVNIAPAQVDLARAGFVYYRKAPLFYEAYRAKFGDAVFFSFLSAYVQRYQYRLVHYPDLAGLLVGAATGREAEARDFVTRWLTQKNLPQDLAQ